ncbi:glycosyltransferase family 2 protein [Brachyspira hyodysenteriae]|uniref:glycosyltransferase family 2 protein n=1 Tax=Brachyspira hyodysenteriae TaxID=159 RepID=UPI0022CD6A2F|nr:glycosyltransferase family 2 protein [Brachyspira hyodysenteriae]MCZ9926949.1 glycosyltransferase family 2 protein [Brachyspira hyodysenteriae]MCZ9977470.1 glycosyltransferase family 2 protein [Brachyspira hyodysenteriae]MCZ9995214.1 glycosyltransferase family 2 protein [Brachyspira hyodysenteriae]MDA0044310.1 glycosyltransferase family 2 protein [Brachyspira hyodysenteriae]MDA0056090.1 glycosyltransferase family 2 protein [Brachyspira hyodysenteriae]
MKVSAIIPCYNEELTIKQVIEDIKKYSPECEIYVFDNNSTDNSYNIAKEAGAIVKKVMYQGKGEVVRQAFSIVESDIYILIDGDNECDASAIPKLVHYLIDNDLDMVTVVRKAGKYRKGHSFGNKMITSFAKFLFGNNVNDILSGYRVFSKKIVKTFPCASKGFEIEAELTIFAMQMRLQIGEIEAEYKSRPEGSFSKLNTFKDGFRILGLMIYLLMTEKPIIFWWIIAFIFALCGFYYGIPLIIQFINIGVVPVATSVLATGFVLLSGICIITGLIMNAVGRVISENRRFKYNSIK